MKKHILPIVFSAISLAIWALFYQDLPAELPVHWGSDGEATRYAAKLSAFGMVHGWMIGMYVMMWLFPKIDPKRKKNEAFYRRGYPMVAQLIFLLGFAISIGTVMIGLGYDWDMTKVIFALVGVLFIVAGNYLPQTKRNFFAGVRTPWTLMNESVWRRTHRLAGYSFIVAGALMLLGGFLPTEWLVWCLIVTIALAAGIPVVYSYILYRKMMKGDEGA